MRLPTKRGGTHYTELVFLQPMRSVGQVVHFATYGARNIGALFFMLGWPGAVSKKAYQDTIRRTCVFVSGGICGSRSALRYIRGMKYRCTSFLAAVGPKRFQKKRAGTRYAKDVFL
jgi:hypothetical protein